MRGSLPFTDPEYDEMLRQLRTPRDRCLFTIGCATGFRISELISLNLGDVRRKRTIFETITVARRNTKGQRKSRTVDIGYNTQEAIAYYLKIIDPTGTLPPKHELWTSQRKGRISSKAMNQVIKNAARRAEMSGKRTSHSMRKTFAKKCFETFDRDLLLTQEALGHESITSTVMYLESCNDLVRNAIRNLTFGTHQQGENHAEEAEQTQERDTRQIEIPWQKEASNIVDFTARARAGTPT